jgi:ATP-dependent DNA ligase
MLTHHHMQSLLGLPFRRRRELLHQRFAPFKPTDIRLARYDLVPSCTDNDPEKVKEFFDETLKVSCPLNRRRASLTLSPPQMKAEGIMVKVSLPALRSPSSR